MDRGNAVPFKLEDLELDEISLVDDPASPGAQIVLAKRADGDQQLKKESRMADMSTEEKKRLQQLMDKGMSEDEARREMAKEAKMDDYKKRAEAAEAKVDTLTKQVDTLTKAVTDQGLIIVKNASDELIVNKRSDDDYVEIDGEKVLKASVPAPVLRSIEKQAQELAELKKSNEMVRLDKRAETEIPNFAGNASAKRALLKAVDAIEDEELRKAVQTSLTSASKLLAKSFTELGHLGTDESAEGTMGELNKLAREYADKHGVTFEKAFSEVTKSGKGAELFAKRNTN